MIFNSSINQPQLEGMRFIFPHNLNPIYAYVERPSSKLTKLTNSSFGYIGRVHSDAPQL